MVDELAAAAISHGTCHRILSDDLNTSHATQHSVPPILTQYQPDYHKSICGDLTESAVEDGVFLNQIITGGETWYFLYDPQLKQQLAT
jgi:hypothetical protein